MASYYTKAIALGRPKKYEDGPLNTPVSFNSTYHAGGTIGYARYGNTACSDFEEVVGSLDNGKTLAFSSGMSAFQAIINILPVGSTVISSNQGYAGVNATLHKMHLENKINFIPVNIENTAEVLENLVGASLLWVETPTNPMLKTADSERLIDRAKAEGVIVGFDNTFATPLTQKPLDLGADISLNSATKYFAGHSDVLAGTVSTNNKDLYEKIEFNRKINGTILQPFEAFLALRGIRTFPLRFERAQDNARFISEKLKSYDYIKKVNYPGYGAVLSFEINGTPEDAEKICNSSRLISNATSLGGVESLWERRRRWELESKTVPESLIRLSVGCECKFDLWSDIKYSIDSILFEK
jgi:cystathionine gamma-synthase